MKSIFWPVVLACALLLLVPSAVVGDAGSDFLDLMEQQVDMVADASISCFDSDKRPYRRFIKRRSAVMPWSATNNTFDFSKSYVRQALMEDIASLNQPTTPSRIFFGSIKGTWQVYPDSSEESVDSLSSEPRTRPWFRASTSVVKVVVVLIDHSPSMSNALPPHVGSGTLLAAAKTAASQLLLTLNAGDHVNIIVFDGTRVVQLAPSAVFIQSQGTTEYAELDPLRLEMSKQTVQIQHKPSDLNAAILAALPNFDSNPLAAKIILVFTDGVFATLENVILPSANLTSIKVFMYKLPQSNYISLAGNSLIRELCAVGGHFEPILKNLENPLLALHKYFSYLANLKRISTKGKPQYSFVHRDLEQIGGNIILVTKPVFWGDDFVGVAGVTIFIESLGSLTDAVNQALQSKITGYSVPTTLIVLSAANCTIVNKTLGAFSDRMDWLLANAYGGIDDSYYIANKGQNCFQTSFARTISGNGNSKKWIVVVVVGTTCLILFVMIGFILLRWFKNQAFHKEYVSQEWPPYYHELKDINGISTNVSDYYKLAIDSIALVQNIVEEANIRPLQLNDGQCKVVAQELAIVRDFLLAKSDQCVANQNGMKALCHLYYAIKKASFLIEKCSCKTSESWIITAMTLVDTQEYFVAIILDLQLWRMVLDIVIASASHASDHKMKEMLMIMDEEYEELYKKLHRSDGALQHAALEDKRNVVLKLEQLQEFENDLEYLHTIHLLNWLDQFKDEAQKVDSNDHEKLAKFEDPVILGSGGCGTVFRVTWLGLQCALKLLNVKDEREATVLKGLIHPNIIQLYHYWEAPIDNPKSHLLMELMVVDLGIYIESLTNKASSRTHENDKIMPFSLPVAIDIMLQVAHAMQYLHERHLVHRDLKTTNILVKQMSGDVKKYSGESYLEIKLADFGLAKNYNNTSTDNRHTANTGTPVYGAPEIFGRDLAAERNFPPMADVWSFGVTCAEILSGKRPYVGENRKTLQSRIANENLRPTLPKCCPPFLAFCISSCWEFQPQRRPNFASIVKMLRHAKLLSLNLTKLDDSRMFFAYTTHRKYVKGFSTSL